MQKIRKCKKLNQIPTGSINTATSMARIRTHRSLIDVENVNSSKEGYKTKYNKAEKEKNS